ncbi:porin [Aquisalimonas sp. APHAB1-3]|uniref:porin n=1 Tax=Aquisalimonas sp. APHAB1-3 TaxID=3402080 RepID=UPI003AAAD7D7
MATRTMKATAAASMSALALAALSTTAQADDGPELYGIIDIGLESYNSDLDDGAPDVFQGNLSPTGNSDDKDFALVNLLTSRLGVRGSEEINENLTASYNYELQADVLNLGSNATSTRLGWAALEGDWGQVKIGTQWSPLFNYAAWNTNRMDTHGFGSYYYTTSLLGDAQFGFQQSSTVSYNWGSPYDYTQPFAFSVAVGVGQGESGEFDTGDTEFVINPETGAIEEEPVTATEDNNSGISSVQLAGQYAFDERLMFNAVYYQDIRDYNNAEEFEVSLFNIGARWVVTPALEVGVNYTLVDRDTDDDENREAFAIAGFYDFGQGWEASLGVATGSDDLDEDTNVEGRDIDLNLYGDVRYSFSDRTNVRFEYEYIDYDGDAVDDNDDFVALIGIQHHF